MSSSKGSAALDTVPLRNLKHGEARGETERQKVTEPAGAMVEAAMRRAKLEPKELAAFMGISVSVLQRGFKDQESISWQRIKAVPHRKFQRALLAVQAEEDSGVVTTLMIAIPQEKAS